MDILSSILVVAVLAGIATMIVSSLNKTPSHQGEHGLQLSKSRLREALSKNPTREDVIMTAEEVFAEREPIDLKGYGKITACAGRDLFVWRDANDYPRLINFSAASKLLRQVYSHVNHDKIPNECTAAQNNLTEFEFYALSYESIENTHNGKTLRTRFDQSLNLGWRCEFDESLIK